MGLPLSGLQISGMGTVSDQKLDTVCASLCPSKAASCGDGVLTAAEHSLIRQWLQVEHCQILPEFPVCVAVPGKERGRGQMVA